MTTSTTTPQRDEKGRFLPGNTVSSDTLANLRNASHIVVNIPTDRRLSHNESEQLCDAVESAFAQKGMKVRAAGGTNYGTSIAVDVYKRV